MHLEPRRVTPGRSRAGPVRVAWAAAEAPGFRRDVGRRLMAMLAGELIAGKHLDVVRRCAVCGGPHGRPVDSAGDVVLSASYAGDLVVAAAAPRAAVLAIGVDVERTDPASDRRLDEIARLFDPRPAPDMETWTRIEAILKADGRGLLVPPDEVRIGREAGSMLPGGRRAAVADTDSFEVATIPGPDGFVISVAVRRDGPPGR